MAVGIHQHRRLGADQCRDLFKDQTDAGGIDEEFAASPTGTGEHLIDQVGGSRIDGLCAVFGSQLALDRIGLTDHQ